MPDWLHRLRVWINTHETFVTGMLALSMMTFVGSLAIVSVVIVRMPADYFMHNKPPSDSWRGQHPAIRFTLLAFKNFFGVVLVVVGILLSFPGIPGQGLLTVLIGLGLLNFPGKRTLELKIVRSPRVRNSINWIRAKRARAPLELPSE